VSRILRQAAAAKGADLESWETALRGAVLAAGATALGVLLNEIGSGRRSEKILCECGEPMKSQGLKGKKVLTILGPVSYRRTMFACAGCKQTRYPGDEELDITKTSRSPGLRRMMARAGSRSTFKEGRDDLEIYAGVAVSAKDLERVAERIGAEMECWVAKEQEELMGREMPVKVEKTIPIMYVSYDGTGIPMTKAEVRGRRGQQTDGSAFTREAKLGCVFTQTGVDKKGFAVREPDSTSFVGAIETAGIRLAHLC
jgi:hypothetical protein